MAKTTCYVRDLIIRILPVAAVAMIGGCALTAQVRGQGTRTDEDAIRRLIALTTEGMNKHDAKAIAQLYTPDADLVNVFGTLWKGPAEIENGMKAHFNAELRDSTFKTVNVTIRFIKPDIAIADVTNEVSGIVAPNGQKVPTHGERSMRVFVKANGRWLMTAFHNTQVSPPEATGR